MVTSATHKETSRLGWLLLGVFTLWFFLMYSPYYPVALSSALSHGDASTVAMQHTIYSLVLIALFVVQIVWRKNPTWLTATPRTVAAGVVGFAGSLLLALNLGEGDLIIVSTVALVMVACAVAHFLSVWICLLCEQSVKDAVFLVGVSFALFSVCWVVLLIVDKSLLDFLVLCAPLISLGAYLRIPKLPLPTPASNSFSSLRILPWSALAICIVFICLGACAVRVFTTMAQSMNHLGSFDGMYQIYTAISGIILVMGFTVLFAKKGPSVSNCVSVIAAIALVYMAALLIIGMADANGAFVLAAKRVLVGCEHAVQVLVLVMLAAVVIQQRLSSVLVVALYGIVVCVAPQLISLDVLYLTGALEFFSTWPYVAPLAAAGTFVLAAAAMALLVNYSRRTVANTQVSDEERVHQLCAQATAAYDVTPRELDVVVYTYRGYSARKIAETLLVSESTVKAHLAHSYRKLGIHSKQELIALIEQFSQQQ